MKSTYSIYEAKAKLSEIIRSVKQRRSITITERGREVARVVPLEPQRTFADRVRDLEGLGLVTGEPKGRPSDIRPIAHRPGALKRFLETR